MNERDILRHRLNLDKSNKAGLEYQYDAIHNEMNKQNRLAIEKMNRLEEVSLKFQRLD